MISKNQLLMHTNSVLIESPNEISFICLWIPRFLVNTVYIIIQGILAQNRYILLVERHKNPCLNLRRVLKIEGTASFQNSTSCEFQFWQVFKSRVNVPNVSVAICKSVDQKVVKKKRTVSERLWTWKLKSNTIVFFPKIFITHLFASDHIWRICPKQLWYFQF